VQRRIRVVAEPVPRRPAAQPRASTAPVATGADRPRTVGLHLGDQSRGHWQVDRRNVIRGCGPFEHEGLNRPTVPCLATHEKRTASKTTIVQQRGRDHGEGNSRAYYVADHMIDARSQTGTAPDEQTAMRYPTRASELDHRRLRVPPSPLHDPSSRPRASRGNDSGDATFGRLVSRAADQQCWRHLRMSASLNA
jgi:hypothetical protein